MNEPNQATELQRILLMLANQRQVSGDFTALLRDNRYECRCRPGSPDACSQCCDQDGNKREPLCQYCLDHQGDSMMPPHHASERCESGKHTHCTCDACY